jgi:hypothetical protein
MLNVSIYLRGLVSASLSAGVALAASSVAAQPVKPPPPRLSVFVLDTHRGRPATGLKVDFSAKDPSGYKFVKMVTINTTGNTDEPVFKTAEMVIGDSWSLCSLAKPTLTLSIHAITQRTIRNGTIRRKTFE